MDEPSQYARLDPSGLRNRIRDLPRQCSHAWQKALAFPIPENWPRIDRVVVGGMGGSAIAGDLAADLAAVQPSVPVSIVRDRRFPFALREGTLFIACSYSGTTDETLSLFQEALASPAAVLAVSAGGLLADRAGAENAPLLDVDIDSEPRSAVGYNLMLLLGLLSQLGLAEIDGPGVNRSVESLSRTLSHLTEDAPTEVNPAKRLAMELEGKLILVYGGGLFSGMARRWKAQFNENAKTWAFHEPVPESLHNAVEAYRSLAVPRDGVTALLLRPHLPGGADARSLRVLSELLRRNNIPHRTVDGGIAPPLGQLLNMLLLGDYLSYYLAILRGVDPSPNPTITEAKELLERYRDE